MYFEVYGAIGNDAVYLTGINVPTPTKEVFIEALKAKNIEVNGYEYEEWDTTDGQYGFIGNLSDDDTDEHTGDCVIELYWIDDAMVEG
jgi:Sec7-like guanine-nucleotide exchange factor